jgi:Mrp family chromosome partitioning ATPase
MRRYRGLVLVIVVICAGLGVLYGVARPHQYKATASVVLQDPRISAIVGGNNSTTGNYIPDQVIIMKLPSVVAGAAAALAAAADNGPTYSIDDFLSRLAVTNATGTDEVTVTFTASSPATARAGANAELASYEAQVRATQKAQVQSTLTNIDQAVANLSTGGKATVSGSATDQLRQQLLALRAEVVANGSSDIGISAVSPARLPTTRSGTSTALLGIIGGVVGLLLSALITYLLAARRPQVAHRFDPEVVLHAPLITEVGDFRDERLRTTVPARDRPDSAAAEAFRFASSSVVLKQAEHEAVVVAVISASTDDGRTTIAANLGVTRAREGARVLVIDADFEQQTLTSVLLGDLAPRPGFANLVDGSSTMDAAIIPVQLGDHTVVSLLTGGTRPSGATQPIASFHSRRILDDLRKHFDLVIVDTPPMLTAAYGAKIALEADLRLVVVSRNSPASELVELNERLNFVGADLIGYIFNRAPLRRRADSRRSKVETNGRSGDREPQDRLSESAAAMVGSSVSTANWAPSAAGTVGARRSRADNPSEPTNGR